MRGQQTVRVIKLMLLLSHRAHSTPEIVRKLQIEKYTIRRDIQLLSDIGIPVYESESPSERGQPTKWYGVDRDWARRFI